MRPGTLGTLDAGALTALGPFTIDLYLPAFPTLQSELGVSAAAIQLTLTGTMVGFGLGRDSLTERAAGRQLPVAGTGCAEVGLTWPDGR